MACVVLVMVFLGALGGLHQGFNMLDNARMATTASQILQSQMENIRLLDWDYIGGNAERDSSGKWYFQTLTMTDNLATTGHVDLLPVLPKIIGFNAIQVNQQAITRFTEFSLDVSNSALAGSHPDRSSQIKVLSLSIAWRSPSGAILRRQFNSFYAKNGLNDFYYTVVRP